MTNYNEFYFPYYGFIKVKVMGLLKRLQMAQPNNNFVKLVNLSKKRSYYWDYYWNLFVL